jgi:hypothetical protein
MCTVPALDWTNWSTAITVLQGTFPFSYLSWLISFFTQLVSISPTAPGITITSGMLSGMSVNPLGWLSNSYVVEAMSILRWAFSLLFSVSFIQRIVMRYV